MGTVSDRTSVAGTPVPTWMGSSGGATGSPAPDDSQPTPTMEDRLERDDVSPAGATSSPPRPGESLGHLHRVSQALLGQALQGVPLGGATVASLPVLPLGGPAPGNGPRQKSTSDADAVQAVAAATAYPMERLQAMARTLRRHDPGVRDLVEPDSLEPSLTWIVGAGDEAARDERFQRLVDMLDTGRILRRALSYEMELDAMRTSGPEGQALRQSFRGMLRASKDDDAVLMRALLTCDTSSAPAEAMEAFRLLFKASHHAETAADDLRAVRDLCGTSQVPWPECAALLARVRSREKARESRRAPGVPLQAAMELVVAAPDAKGRLERAEALAALLKADSGAGRFTRYLSHLVAAPAASDGLKGATHRLLHLDGKLAGSEENILRLFDRTQAAAARDGQSLPRRVLHLAGDDERTVQRLARAHGDAERTLQVLDTLEQGALDDEPLGEALDRFEALFGMGGLAGFGDIQAAFVGVVAPVTSQPWTSRQKWDQFHELAHTIGSVPSACAVWRAMGSAATAKELEARKSYYTHLLAAVHNDSRAAASLYASLADVLKPGDSVAEVGPRLEALLAHQRPEMAAEAFRVACECQDLAADEADLVTQVLAHAEYPPQARILSHHLQRPVADETLTTRGQILLHLLNTGLSPHDAAEVFQATRDELGARQEFKELGLPFASLLGVLRRAGRPEKEEGHRLLGWLSELAFPPAIHTPLPDLLSEFCQLLAVGVDLEGARQRLETTERRRMSDHSASRVERGGESVTVGGVRIPVRQVTG